VAFCSNIVSIPIVLLVGCVAQGSSLFIFVLNQADSRNFFWYAAVYTIGT
jgi:hypothetical protein